MHATIIKKHSRNSSKCNAGYRREAVETAIFWVSRLTTRSDDGPGTSTMLVGNYEIEMDEKTLVALHARIGEILADHASDEAARDSRTRKALVDLGFNVALVPPGYASTNPATGEVSIG